MNLAGHGSVPEKVRFKHEQCFVAGCGGNSAILQLAKQLNVRHVGQACVVFLGLGRQIRMEFLLVREIGAGGFLTALCE